MFLIRLRYARLVLLLATLISAPASAAEDIQAQIEQYLQACVDVEQFMGSVLVVKDDHELVARGWGFANVELQVPNTTKTKFRLGSITKQFTATAIMMLADQGKLAIEDPVGKHLDGSPDAWSGVSLHHLLCHTSGIPNFTSFPDYAETMTLATTPTQIIARFKDKPLEFTPGEKFAYSNSGYVVLGAVIEKVSGKPYEQFLKEAIFEPLEMRDTGYDHHDQILVNRASGYDERNGRLENAAFIDMSIPFAAGGLYSTIEDLRRWDRALRSDTLLSAASLAMMFTPNKDDYGYGWQMESRCDRRLVKHGGGINGFSAYMIHIPETQSLVVVLSNVASHRPGRMAHDLISILLQQPYKLPRTRQAVELDPAAYDGLVGLYRLGPDFQVTITRDGGHLYSAVSENSKDELFAESDTEFFYKVVDAQITFIRDGEGRANRLVLHQDGRDTVGIRIEAETDETRNALLGIQISPLCEEVRKRQHLADAGGVAVVKVLPGTTAAEVGLLPGDVVLAINGARILDVTEFLIHISTIQPGNEVELEIVRDAEKQTKRGTMKERPR